MRIPELPGHPLESGETDERRGFDHSRSVGLFEDLLRSQAGVSSGNAPVVKRHWKAHQGDGSFTLVSGAAGMCDRLLEGDLLLVPMVLQPVNVGDAAPGFGEPKVVAQPFQLRQCLFGGPTQLRAAADGVGERA